MYQNFNKIYRAAIYVRLSKEDGDLSSSAKLESNSISNQKALILDFLKDKKDIEVVSVRVDDGYTGSNFERPAFQAMLEDIRRGIVDCVVVKDLSRFGREYIDSGKYIERLFPALGVRFIAINDNYDSLQGSWFQKETRWCRKQVESGVIDLLGTDMHRIDWRAPEIGQALSWLDGHVSPERIQQLVYKNPLKIIRKEKIK